VVDAAYHDDLYSFFKKEGISKKDQWSGKRPNNRKRMKVFYPMKISLPRVDDRPSVAGAEAECHIRTFIVSHVFFVPYGTIGALAACQMTAACKMAKKKSVNLPCVSLCRMLPKGRYWHTPVKEVHDDGNAGIIMGIWTRSRL
jgi:hypothetical protein